MKLKLNVVLAKTDHLAKQFSALIRDYIETFAKGKSIFKGEKKTYDPLPGTVDIPSERGVTIVVSTVEEKLQYFVETSKEYINAKFNQEKTNAIGVAQADLIVEGQNWGRYTSLELLALKSLLTDGDLNTMYSILPVYSDAEEWAACTDESYGNRVIMQSPRLSGVRKSITKEQYILFDPNVESLKDTSKYVPQVAVKETVLDLGNYSWQRFTGETSTRRRAEILRRKTTLLNAVIEALKTANEAEVVQSELTADKIFSYLHGN